MDNRKVKFTWDIHYKCNFRCPYCWFYRDWGRLSRKNLYLSPEEWFKHWEKIHKKYKEVHIEITGGEPFLYPNFIELIKLLSTIHTIKITNNLSGDIERFAREIDPERVNLDLNFHALFSDLEPLIKKVLILKDAGFKCGVCYLAYPPQMKQIDHYRKRFEKDSINFALAAFWGEYQGKKYPESYTPEEAELIKPFLGDIDRIAYHLKGESPKGRLCYAGYRSAVLQADGNIVRCGPLAHQVIGSILDEDFSLHSEPQSCEAEACPCNEYVNILETERV